MKEKINRLAKGIVDEETPVLLIRPESFDETVFIGKQATFALEFESVTGSSMRGICCTDEFRIGFTSPSFMGRLVHETFTVDASGLNDGDELTGTLHMITNGGEYRVPYHFTVRRAEGAVFGKAAGREDTGDVSREAIDDTDEAFGEEPGQEEVYAKAYRKFLAAHIPNDDELIQDICTALIREEVTGDLAFAFFEQAVLRGMEITHLYESYLAAWPESKNEPMSREVLLYFSYERNLPPLMADKLYRNIICHESESSELYRFFEPGMREHALRSLAEKRMNGNLSYIYDRILYPDMVDAKAATLLPDIIRAHRITVHSKRAVSVHVKYPELKKIIAQRLKDGTAYVPIYFSNARITFCDADGTERVLPFENEKMMDRTDILRRCFELFPDHPMLLFSAVRQIVTAGIRSEEEKMVLINALNELDPEPGFRSEIIRTLCRAGGDSSWIDRIPVSEMDAETGKFAFKAFLAAGRRRDAYLYIRNAGMESAEIQELSVLATGLIANLQKPVTETGETDRFFLCLCKKVFDAGQATEQIMDLLTEEYEGPAEEMFQILSEADANRLPMHDLPERLLTELLFMESRVHLDETFRIYLKKEIQKETLLRAFFTLRMTDYIEKEDLNVDTGVFEALTSYLGMVRFPENLPEIYMIGLTKHYAVRESLTSKETELCQKLTDILISRGLIFAFTKQLRKKVKIPASICEHFYVEYVGGKNAQPRIVARILPDEEEYMPLNMVRVYRNIFVASTVLFMGEELQYLVYDDAFGPEPVQQGVITVKKMHGKEEDSFLLLNRCSLELNEADFTLLQETMLKYAVDTEVNRGLFQISD